MKKTLPLILIIALLLFGLQECRTSSNNEKPDTRKTLSLQNIDSSVKPGDNFFLYANGKWYDTATILPTESRSGARLEMDYRTKANIKRILEEASSSNNPKGSIEQKIGDLYASGMDSATIENLEYEPVKPFLQHIDSIKNAEDIMKFVADQWSYYNPLIIGQFVTPDDKNSTRNFVVYYQSGLGLPDRDYYFKNDPATLAVVKAYQSYIIRLFILTGDDSATSAKKMNTVYSLEKQMASSHRTNVELRDPQKNYNKISVSDANKKMPVIGWKDFLVDLHVKTDSFNLAQPEYYTKLNELLNTIPIASWKVYLRFHLLDDVSSSLSNDFVQADFNYYNQALNGQKKIKERWERVYGVIDANIGEGLGQLYVNKYFSEDAKKRIQELVNNLQKAFEARIDKLDWMSDSTKKKAKEKLYTFHKKVGYPDKWRDYSNITIDRHNYFNDLMSCGKNEYDYEVNKIGKPVDPAEWGMTPPTNNAYYNPTGNEIVFPAGILQFPMFDAEADDAMNYGGIGMVIGHEMTHGFDDQGAQYDKNGNLKDWWMKEDYEKFKAKGEQVIKLYDSFTVLDSLHVNGRLTQGENTADLGGIAIAYDAFKLTKEGKDTSRIDGFTPDQRFFLSFAQSWRRKVTDASLRQQVATDPHSPSIYRVLAPLMNFTPFYTAFNVKEGDKMFVPEDKRINIW
ncbi:MAG: M13 family metallopeptidase [Chitinophagales bacterium]|nr:M13 family metallopeptidase [Chitinophagales bacterium]